MKFRYPLPASLVQRAASFEDFANGGAVCHVRLADGTVHAGVLLSNALAIIAMRGHDELPFAVADVSELFQTDEDRAPAERGNWKFFDEWPA